MHAIESVFNLDGTFEEGFNLISSFLEVRKPSVFPSNTDQSIPEQGVKAAVGVNTRGINSSRQLWPIRSSKGYKPDTAELDRKTDRVDG